jgi:flagellin
MATPLAINTNVGSLTAQRNLQKTARGLHQSISRLSSGTRVNSAADNAAGMAVSENMRAQLKGFQQAMRNANDGVAVLQTAESGYQSLSDLLVRMRELAVQSANDSVSDTERGYLNTEFADLIDEMDRISSVVEYNGIQLLDGTAGSAGTGAMVFQVGTRDSINDRIEINLGLQDSGSLGVNGDTISSLSNAQSIENYGTAMSQIKDTDMAAESSSFSKSNVLQQAGVAMLSQANQTPNLVMRLLG